MKKFFAIFLCLGFCFSCQSVSKVKFTVTEISQAEFLKLVVPGIEVKSSTDEPLKEEEKADEKIDTGYVAMQLDVKLLEPSERKYYDAVLPNNYFSFIAYKNTCEIFFDVRGIKSFKLYINDIEIDAEDICAKVFCKVDISNIVKNGRNILYITNVVKTFKDATLSFRIPYPILTKAKYKLTGVNYEALNLLDEILESQVKNGFPSLQLLVAKDGVILKNSSYGKIYNDQRFLETSLGKSASSITNKTLYDLASNTKMYATVLAIQRLVFERKISIHDKVIKFFPEFVDSKNAKYTGKNEMTLEHLLTHSSGFPAGRAYYTNREIKNTSSQNRKNVTLQKILKTSLINDVGVKVVYSDINYMLLSFIVEKVSGLSFDKFLQLKIYEPLNLKRICFKPTEQGFSINEIAATEYSLERRPRGFAYNGFAHGAVHDPESYISMNGVSGHAGLFSNAESLAVLAQMLINGGGYGNTRILDKSTVTTFFSTSLFSPSYAIGWRAQNNDYYKWAFSTFASPKTFGHTGWTGTFTLIDIENNLIIILLTNAKHSPHVSDQKYEGDYFITRNYGVITSILYSAFLDYDLQYFSTMLIELAVKRFELLLTDERFDNNGFYHDLASIMEVIKKRSKNSSLLYNFLKSEISEKIQKTLDIKLK